MLLPGTRMQIRQVPLHADHILKLKRRNTSFLKDLATLRSPQSSITFLSYLHAKNRLVDFINRGNTTPTRKEYSDYLAYVAQHVQDEGIKVAYGEDVIGIEEEREGTVQIHSRVLTTGETTIRRASQCPMHRNIVMRINSCSENLIISPGGAPCIPRSIKALLPNPRIIHTSSYMSSVEPMLALTEAATRRLKIAVVGAGQSAVEVLLDLHSRLASMGKSTNQAHELHIIVRGSALRPNDGGPFANGIYSPECKSITMHSPE